MAATPLNWPSESKEFIKVQVSGTDAGAPVNIAALSPPEFSFPTKATDPDVWVVGEWEVAGSKYFARILLSGTGKGGTVALAEGTYDVWVRWVDNPESPARKAGQVKVT